MERRSVLNSSTRLHAAAKTQAENELALRVVVLFEDQVTQRWTRELWGRVDHLIGSGEVCREVWRISDLARTDDFADAVKAATKAHVLLVSFRDEGELPSHLREWIEAWVPHRTTSGGAMVALIAVQAPLNAVAGHAYTYLASVARRAGMDFLPHERRLADESRPALRARRTSCVWSA
jgi:hypothetical protein